METRQRTLVKAIVWNLIGLMMMGLVGLVLTGSVMIGGTMAVINTAIGLGCYVAYERFWDRIRWGRFHG